MIDLILSYTFAAVFYLCVFLVVTLSTLTIGEMVQVAWAQAMDWLADRLFGTKWRKHWRG